MKQINKELKNKARAFDTRTVEHPEKKISKATGEVLSITQYSDDGFQTVYTSSDIITLGSGKDTRRWLKADLTADQISTIETCKGDDTMRKIMTEALALAKRITNASRNAGINLDEERKITVNDFVRSQLVVALDTFMGTKSDDRVKLPF